MKAGATFSGCGLYRYYLWREWEPALPRCVFIGLNPSTADETKDDPTIRRCIGFARREGCGRLDMLNMFAWRATDPRAMKSVDEPIGPWNDETIVRVASRARHVVAAWGAHGAHLGRGKAVGELLERSGVRVSCLGTTKSGHPKHPLYLRADTPLVPWSFGGVA